MELIIVLAIVCGMCLIGFWITGSILSMIFWLFVKLPVAIFLVGLGIMCCITVILIPLGKGRFGAAGRVMG